MKNIIINADDFGYRSSVNKAIIDLFNEGIINSTTLMANMPHFEEAIELAHSNKITDQIGVHLVITDGESLTEEARSIPYLFNRANCSREFYRKNLFFLDSNQKNIIFKEYSKQIEKVKKNGIQITHLDTHWHMHEMWGILQVILGLLDKYKIPSLRILNNLETKEIHKDVYRSLVNRYLKIKKVNYTDYFGNQTDFLLKIAKDANFHLNKKVEIMVHPDYNAQGKLIDIIHYKEYDFEHLKHLIIVLFWCYTLPIVYPFTELI